MKITFLFACAAGLALLGVVAPRESASAVAAASAAPPQRLDRADSFLGVHFDFHAGPDCTEIGKHTTREMIENIINLVGPDYLQIDCKGHRGLSSYPTKVGNPAPGFVGDPLRLWRQVTAERGVSLLHALFRGVGQRGDHAPPGLGSDQCRRQHE